jgi:hypothetical protein
MKDPESKAALIAIASAWLDLVGLVQKCATTGHQVQISFNERGPMRAADATGSCSMRKFVAMRNSERFREQLHNETNPARRILLQRLLVEEEDKVGATLELLVAVQQGINDCRRQMAELRSLIADRGTDCPDTTVAKARLETLMASRVLHETYCRKLQSKLHQDGF